MTNARIEKSKTKNQADFNWALGLNRLTLRLMGVWPEEKNDAKSSFTVLIRAPFMILIMFTWLILPQTYALILVIHNLPLVIENLTTNWITFTSCIKLFFIWRSRTMLQPVIKSIKHDWLYSESKWEFETMRKQAFKARLFTISGYVIVCGAYSGFALGPFFGFNIRTITNITDYGYRRLFVQSYFPYNYSKSPYFELSQTFQIFAALFVAMSVSIPDNYFGALVYHTCAQFEILGRQIENLNRHVKVEERLCYRDFYKKFKMFTIRHVHLLNIVSTIEKAFHAVCGTQVLCTSIIVVCLGFQIQDLVNGNTEETSVIRVLTLLAALWTLLLHTFVDCFASEILATHNCGIFHNIYNSKWDLLIHNHNMRNIIPMMMVSRTPKPLSAGKVFHLSLQFYCQLLKTSVGYISMLIAVNRR